VTLPPEITRYLEGREIGPMTQEEADGLEDAVMRYYGISAPFYIQVSRHDWEQHGHAWHFIPEASPFVSGFEFHNTEA